MIDKGLNNIVCDVVIEDLKTLHNWTEFSTNIEDYRHLTSPNITVTALQRDVCIAEIKSQSLDTRLNVYTAPIGMC